MAKAKQATTITTQMALAAWNLAVEMWYRPWIVEFSMNSRIVEEFILEKDKQTRILKITCPQPALSFVANNRHEPKYSVQYSH